MDPQFTISILTVNETSALLRLTACLSRHRVHIESLTMTQGEVSDVYRHTIVVRADPECVRRTVKQIESGVGVLRAEYHAEGETVDREVALYKLSVDGVAGGKSLEKLVRNSRARVLVAGSGYVVVEKTGHKDEIEELFSSLEPFGVMEFVRSGRVAVTKPAPEAVAHIDDKLGTEEISSERKFRN